MKENLIKVFNKWFIVLMVLVVTFLFSINNVTYATEEKSSIEPLTTAMNAVSNTTLTAGFSNYATTRSFPETTILCADNYNDLPNQSVVMLG